MDTISSPTGNRTAIQIRRASARDASNIVRLLMEWHESVGIEYPEANEEDVLRWVVAILTNGFVTVADRAGRIIGVIGVQATPFAWNLKKMHFRDAFFYVSAAHRKGGVADALMKAVQGHAATQGIPLMMSIISGKGSEHLERFYRIQGGHYVGGTLIFGLPEKE